VLVGRADTHLPSSAEAHPSPPTLNHSPRPPDPPGCSTLVARLPRKLALLSFVSLASLASPRALDDVGHVGYEAIVRPLRELQLTSAIPGLLSVVHVDRGDRVEAGQLLAALESSVERASLELARARARSGTGLQLARQRFTRAEVKFERHAALHDRSLISDEEFSDLRDEKRAAELALRKAEEDEGLARLELERARRRLELRSVRSPVDGVVLVRNLSGGELVSHSSGAPILTLAQLDPLRIDVRVPVSELGSLRAGVVARVWLDATRSAHLGSVAVVDPVVDPSTETVGVRVLVPNPEHSIPAGLRCRVIFP